MELGHGRQGQTETGGSEMGKYPPCQEEQQCLSTSLMWNAPTHQEGPLPPIEGWLHTLHEK